jgi:hypothetical protein
LGKGDHSKARHNFLHRAGGLNRGSLLLVTIRVSLVEWPVPGDTSRPFAVNVLCNMTEELSRPAEG